MQINPRFIFQEITCPEGSFMLNAIKHPNPNVFLRNYVNKKYGKTYLMDHVFDAEDKRSARENAPDSVIVDLKRECYILLESTLII